MRDEPDIRAAVDAACSAGLADGPGFRPARRASFERTRAKIVEFLRNVPEDMTARELRDELEG